MIRRGVAIAARGLWKRSFTNKFHPSAQTGFTKDNIERYESGRPSYSPEVIGQVVKLIEAKSSSRSRQEPYSFLEIGAGTGKFTTSFLHTVNKTETFKDCRYLALEPSEFIEKLSSLDLKIDVKKGVSEDIPVESHSIDAVLIAQAFHWMANERSIQEIARVLKRGHPLILIWNGYDESIDWLRRFQSQIIVPRYPADTPRYQTGAWESVFRGSVGRALFQPIEKLTCSNSVAGDVSMVVNRALSTSVISNQGEEVRREVEREVMELISTHPDTRDIPLDTKDGFIMRYETLIAFTSSL
jgi:SAM-dependent methyltransferase